MVDTNKRQEIFDVFIEQSTVTKIKQKLPKLFHIAELESSRAGKIGMEVGSLREKVIIGLLINTFGENNINAEIPITEPETDIKVKGNPFSIKTITGDGGVKAVWTVDALSAKNFINNYQPKCDILLIKIVWGTTKGGFFLVPLEVQQELFRRLGRTNYLKMPKAGTNPRGVEFNKRAVELMVLHPKTIKINIDWKKGKIDYDPYKRWVDYWADKLN